MSLLNRVSRYRQRWHRHFSSARHSVTTLAIWFSGNNKHFSFSNYIHWKGIENAKGKVGDLDGDLNFQQMEPLCMYLCFVFIRGLHFHPPRVYVTTFYVLLCFHPLRVAPVVTNHQENEQSLNHPNHQENEQWQRKKSCAIKRLFCCLELTRHDIPRSILQIVRCPYILN